MSKNNVLVTGPPRSGTTLTCHLLNKLPDTVALHEPMKPKKFAQLKDHEEICQSIQRFCEEQRESIHTRKRAISKNVGGAVPDNPFGAGRSDAGLRQSLISKGEIVVEKNLSQNFMLIVKHPASFTAVLEGLVKRFPVYAVIRNPLGTLASWSSIDVNVQSGHAPAAERLDSNLKAKLAAIEGDLDRQIYLLSWFHEQFHRYLPEQSIIRYESVIESGGKALSVVRPEAEDLSEPLESQNKNRLYDYQNMLRIGERLLKSEGAYWESYTKESVERLLNDLHPQHPERAGTVAKPRRRGSDGSQEGRVALPVSRFDKAFGIARSVKAFLNPRAGATRDAVPDAGQHGEQAEDPNNARRPMSEHEKKIESKKQELKLIATELRATKKRGERTERIEQMRRAKRKKQEIFQLKQELRAAEERAGGELETGALPDFAVIGGAKCGTTFFYHLLTLHPYVEPAAMKEPHYFDRLFDEGTEWYRGCFSKPRWKDGQRTISGDGTPGYLFHTLAPERMADVIPQARLIALLRNPVERTYSAYHHRVRNGSERRTFEDAVEEALKAEEARRPGLGHEAIERGDTVLDEDLTHGFLSNCVYVDHLLRWSEFFDREQMLVLKSEDFFERPSETLKPVLDFLGLPDWEPGSSELPEKRKNKGGYEQTMDPAIRRRLEEFFEPHNRRLYEYLDEDFGW